MTRVEEEYRERQENEVLAIASMYPDECQDLRRKDVWSVPRPPELAIRLHPASHELKDGGDEQANCVVTLRLKMSARYPDSPPTVSLYRAEGLSEEEISSLKSELEKLSNEKVGGEMVLDLVEAGRTRLLAVNRPRFQSLHAEKEHHEQLRHREEVARQQQQQERLLAEQQRRRLEVQQAQQRRRQQLHEQRAALRNSISREDGEGGSSGGGGGESESSDECSEHAGTCRLSVPGRDEVLCGHCMEHTVQGAAVRTGLDLRSGVPLRVQQWMVRWRPMSAKQKLTARAECNGNSDPPPRDKKDVKEQLSTLQREFSSLQKLRHDNLLLYQGISIQETDDSASVFILQDLVQGYDLSRHLHRDARMDVRQLRLVASGLVTALAYLHSRHVIHRDLRHTSVFVDASGRVKLADYSLCRRISDMCGIPTSPHPDFPPYMGRSGKKADVHRLGLLLMSLAQGSLVTDPNMNIPEWLPEPARYFLTRCLDPDEQRRWSAAQLAEHGFLTSDAELTSSFPDAAPERALVPEPPQPTEVSGVSPSEPRQRIASDFIVLEHLGRGGFGEVLKVRNRVDGKLYAVKKILLENDRQQDRHKIAVEAQHLSILQHENIVRYYTSWMETDELHTNSRSSEDENENGREDSDSGTEDETLEESALSDGPDSSSSILFEHASDLGGGGEAENIAPYTTPSVSIRRQRKPRVRLCLCIQMEYCEKSTLRTTLGRLSTNHQLLWQLLREIVEGLAHIHQHGLIHRDLKPDNIFLDQHEHVKIGDFGLATSKVVKPRSEDPASLDRSQLEAAGDASDTSYAYAVGTALYRAPELQPGAIGRRVYTNKVDIYSLGVIWYEMCCGTFTTASERIHRLTQVRQPEVAVPDEVRQRLTDQQLQLLSWLLSHQPTERPSCVQLLSSDLIPSPPLEEARVRTLFRETVRRPDTKRYMHLVSACMSQRATLADDCAYDVTLGRPVSSPNRAVLSEVARSRLVCVFRCHGAVPLSAPLLTIPTEQFTSDESVRLMTGTGSVVELPRSQRLPLARLLARAASGPLRHYTIERVYQERLPRGLHPRERHETLFGALAPPSSALLADAELLAVLSEIVSAFPVLAARDYQLVLGHTLLLDAALDTAGVPTEGRSAVLDLLTKLGRDSARTQLQRELESLGLSERAVSQLVSRLEVRGSLERVQPLFASRRPSQAARQALHEIATVTEYAERLGVTLPVIIFPGLVLGQQQRLYSGIVFQLSCTRRRGGTDVLAVGGRYDLVLEHYWSLLGPAGVAPPAATAVSVSFDKCVSAVAEEGRTPAHAPFDVVVLDGGDKTVARRQAAVVKGLWAGGVRTFLYGGADSPAAADEAARWASLQGARALVLPKDTDAKVVRVRPLESRATLERSVPADDLLSHLASLGITGGAERSPEPPPPPSAPSRSEPSSSGLPVRWIVHRDTARPKDRQLLEAAAERQLAPELAALGTSARIEVLLVELDQEDLQQLTRLNLNELESSFQHSVDEVLEICRGQRKYVAKVCDELARTRVRRCVVVLFNYQTSCRLILVCSGSEHWR